MIWDGIATAEHDVLTAAAAAAAAPAAVRHLLSFVPLVRR